MLNEQRQNQSKQELRRRERPELSEDKMQQGLHGEQCWAGSCPLTWGTPWSRHSPQVEWPVPGHAFHSRSDPPRRNGPSVSGWCHSRCTRNTRGGGDVPAASRTRRCRSGEKRCSISDEKVTGWRSSQGLLSKGRSEPPHWPLVIKGLLLPGGQRHSPWRIPEVPPTSTEQPCFFWFYMFIP